MRTRIPRARPTPVSPPPGSSSPSSCSGPRQPRRAQLWGMPASNRWFFEASEFPGEEVNEPLLQATPQTLEAYLGLH